MLAASGSVLFNNVYIVKTEFQTSITLDFGERLQSGGYLAPVQRQTGDVQDRTEFLELERSCEIL